MATGYQLDFLPIGENSCSGDAITIKYGSPEEGWFINVIDGGFRSCGETVVSSIKRYYDIPTYIDHVVLTHPDGDHAGGLITVLESFDVGTLWMNRPWLHSAEIIHNFHGNWTVEGLTEHLRSRFPVLVELEDLANKKGTTIRDTFQGDQIGAFWVLAPTRARYLETLPELDKTPTVFREIADAVVKFASDTMTFIRESWNGETLSSNPPPTNPSNETSVVQAALLCNKTLVLTGDAGPIALTEAKAFADRIGLPRPDFFQVPHHGSRRNVTPEILNTWLGEPLPEGSAEIRGSSFCSAAANDSKHPKKKVLNAFKRRGYPVWVTNGLQWLSSENMPRDGWSALAPQPFHPEVEE